VKSTIESFRSTVLQAQHGVCTAARRPRLVLYEVNSMVPMALVFGLLLVDLVQYLSLM
jgi:hypothetical protein